MLLRIIRDEYNYQIKFFIQRNILFVFKLYIFRLLPIYFYCCILPIKESHLDALLVAIKITLKFNSKYIQILQPSSTGLKSPFHYMTSHKSPLERISKQKIKLQVRYLVAFRPKTMSSFSYVSFSILHLFCQVRIFNTINYTFTLISGFLSLKKCMCDLF